MARTQSTPAHRKANGKRTIRIPVGGHPPETPLRGQYNMTISIDEIAFFEPEETSSVVEPEETPPFEIPAVVEVAPPQEEKEAPVVEEAPIVVETVPGFDLAACLAYRTGEFKAALASGSLDLHLKELEAGERNGQNRKSILGLIAARIAHVQGTQG